MTLLITVLAAVVSTVIWYTKESARRHKVGMLCWMFWGASLMWLGDAIFGFMEDGAEFFTPALEDLINESYLGLSVVGLALVVWVIVLLVKDPDGVVHAALKKDAEKAHNA